MGFFEFNGLIWFGAIFILTLVVAVTNNPIPALGGLIVIIGLVVGSIWIYMKLTDFMTEPDDVWQNKDGKFVLKGNGHAVCLKEYIKGFWWTYDMVDHKYIKPTICKESFYLRDSLGNCGIRDFKHMLEINGYQKEAWEKYNSCRSFYDKQHEIEVFTSRFDIESKDEFNEKFMKKSGVNVVWELYSGIGSCTISPILFGYYKHGDKELEEVIKEGREQIEAVLRRTDRILSNNK